MKEGRRTVQEGVVGPGADVEQRPEPDDHTDAQPDPPAPQHTRPHPVLTPKGASSTTLLAIPPLAISSGQLTPEPSFPRGNLR